MKKTFLLVSIMLLTLCFGGCGKPEPADLRLFELKGNVESVKIFYTHSINSKGKTTRYSWKEEGPVYSFNKKGRVVSGTDGQSKLTFSRNNAGLIDSISLPSITADGEFNDGFYSKVYVWDNSGFPVTEEFCNIGGCSKMILIYEDSCIISKKMEERWSEGDEWQILHTYKILNMDSHDNWTKRIHCIDDDTQGKSYVLEDRDITYYEGDNNSAQTLALQEQQERERVERAQQEEQERQRKEREERELQRQKEQMMNVVVGTWRSETIRTRSGYCSMYLYFYSSGKFECKLYDNFTGSCLDRQSGTFSVVPKSSGGSAGIVLNPNSSNSSWIDYKEGSFSDHLYFGDYSFTKSSSY